MLTIQSYHLMFHVFLHVSSAEKSHLEAPLEENINQIVPEEGSARTIEDAIAVLRYFDHVISGQQFKAV